MNNWSIFSLVFLFAVRTSADGVYHGGGGSIPDNNADGLVLSIHVPDHFILTDVDLRLNGLSHPYAGDISVLLEKVGDITEIIVHRIGQVTPGNSGDSSDFGGDYTFDANTNSNIWTAAAGGGSAFVIPPGAYAPSDPFGNGANNHALENFTDLDAFGEWRLYVRDLAGEDVGQLNGWTLILYGAAVCGVCGDSNCDGAVTVSDIGFFVTAVSQGQAAWQALFAQFPPPCDFLCSNDVNADGAVTVSDIGIFVSTILGTPCGD